MHHTSDTPPEPPETQSPVAPRGPNHIQALATRLADALLHIEPLWVTLAGLFVYLSYLLSMGPAFPWIGLALACLPFPLRLIRRGSMQLRTPFDLPVALFMIGALVGFCVSEDRTISLGVFQCTLAVTLLYYSWATSPIMTVFAKWAVILAAVGFMIVLLLVVLDLPEFASQPRFEIGGSGTHHGLAMYLTIIAAILLGVAVFDKSTKTRLFAAVTFLSFLVIVLIMTWDSLESLSRGVSVSGRMPIWENTASLLRESPLAGLGLGCWALAYWDTTALGTVGGITHAHNAYLELYANTGILGVLALLIALGIGAKLSLDIIRSARAHPWYGFGIGVILACVTTLLIGALESAPMGVPLVAIETYYYVLSPIAWLLASFLVVAHRLVTKSPGVRSGQHRIE